MSVKKILIKETHEAFSGNDEMSLMTSLNEIEQKEAEWNLNETTWTIEEILFHVASSKIEYCKQGFGQWKDEYEKPFGDIGKMIQLLERAQSHLMECLHGCSDEDLMKPIQTKFHGESAAHFFWIMIMHDISHGAQIRTIRRAYGSRTHYYPIK
jgi:uncharacterized damage-inducible protein DinB